MRVIISLYVYLIFLFVDGAVSSCNLLYNFLFAKYSQTIWFQNICMDVILSANEVWTNVKFKFHIWKSFEFINKSV